MKRKSYSRPFPQCPQCGSKMLQFNSRPTAKSQRRSYRCQNIKCGKTFHTLEVFEEDLSHKQVNGLRYEAQKA